MNYQTLNGKIAQYMHFCAVELAKWLEKALPDALGEDWWVVGVIDRLSGNQQELVRTKGIKSLDGFDLSALLRITYKNRYHFQKRRHFKPSSMTTVKNMVGVRNNRAHIPAAPPSTDAVISDLKTIEDFLDFVDAGSETCRGLARLIDDIKKDGITNDLPAPPKAAPAAVSNKPRTVYEITENSFVRLASDPNSVGMVMSIDKVGETLRYKVFLDGNVREFYEGQVEPKKDDEAPELKDISEIQRVLTAYLIKKPSSDSLYSLNAARIDFVPYQFRPALKLIKSDKPRLLIADGVGVGKTIEAGLILKEMQARTPLDTVIIICPRPLVAERKWESEMKRFDEDFTPVDGNFLRKIIKDCDTVGAWPEKYKRLIIPYSLLREDLLIGKEDRRGNRRGGLENLDPPPFFDMVIVDEAHHVRNRETQAYKAVEFFCSHANAAVFLTATPLQLGNEDLFSLLNLLYPDVVIDTATFHAMAEPNDSINKALHNLRAANRENDALDALKSAAETTWGRNVIAPNPVYKNAAAILSMGNITREQRVRLINDVESLHSFSSMINRTRRQDIDDFCVRRPYTILSTFTERQKELHDELLNFVSNVMTDLYPSMSLKFLTCTVRRQAASCIFGLAPFVRDIVNNGLMKVPDDDYETDDFEMSNTEIRDDDVDQVDLKKLAAKLIELAENLPAEDNKFDSLANIIITRQGLEKNKMMIFTTFRHTIKYLHKKISALGGIRTAYVDGSVGDDERYDLRERFALPKSDPHALDVLLFTEVGSEGLDYQFCDTLVNYDLPWNPMRIEQRIGRIDRRGQEAEVVNIYNCVTGGTIDEEIHNRCLERIGIFKSSIGDCSEILGEFVKSLQKIIMDVGLTEAERSLKVEQLADNEVRQIEEMRRLEEEEKNMFGVDISSFTGDIERAENPWLSPEAIRRLVSGYLEERLGADKTRFADGKLKLNPKEKAQLADDYDSLKGHNKDAVWASFLRSGAKICNIAFDQDAAKNPKTIFLTPVHTLVRQATMHYFSDKPFRTVIELEISGSDIAAGKYRFQLYIWEYTGIKPRTQLIPVCADKEVQKELPAIVQNAVVSETQDDYGNDDWSELEETHLAFWKAERDKFKSETASNCRFKIESLAQSVNARKNMALNQIRDEEAKSYPNESIINMRRLEMERLDGEFAAKKQKTEENIKLSDIHTTLLVNGMLIVKEAE